MKIVLQGLILAFLSRTVDVSTLDELDEKSPAQECITYHILTSPDRSIDFYDVTERCDSELTPGWYRFAKSAGSQMTTKCVPVFQCGTYGPGWLDGKHPTLEDGTVVRRVCFHIEGGCCKYSVLILIRNCTGFYVYRLSSVRCPFRFCGAPSTTTLLTTTAPLPRKQPSIQQSSECHDYKVLNDKEREKSSYNPFISLGDHTLTTGWYRFEGDAGTEMADKCVPIYHCGTHAPGWLTRGNPVDASRAVERVVCFHWLDNCCQFQQNILVRKCNGYFVYKLPRISVKYLRYCGNSSSTSHTTSR